MDITDLIGLDLEGSNVVFVQMNLELKMAASTQLTILKERSACNKAFKE